jgi:hypothetical protein
MTRIGNTMMCEQTRPNPETAPLPAELREEL